MGGRKVVSESKMKDAITEFLNTFSFFNSLNTEELDLVANHIDIMELDPGDILFKEGDEGDCVYFVVEGELDVIKESVGGIELGVDKVVITKLIKGGSIGEMSVIDKNPRSATVKACKNVTLVAFTAVGFDMVLEDYPDIGINILKGIARLLSLNLRKTSSRLADYMLPIS